MAADTVKKYLGIDIGGTSAKYGIITENGDIVEKRTFPTGENCEQKPFISDLLKAAEWGISRGISGIGVCTLGYVDSETGEVLGGVSNLPFLENMNIRKILCEHYNLPVTVINDVNAVVLGEYWRGAGQECDNFVCITFGTGIGSGLMLNSRVYEGAHFMAGEICYMNYLSEERNLEKEISTKAVMEQAAETLGIETLTGKEFFAMVAEGNIDANDILNQWLEKISVTIANIIVLLDPEKVIIGGGISNERDILVPRLDKLVKKRLPQRFADHITIDTAKYVNDAGMLGAVNYLLFNSSRVSSRNVNIIRLAGQ